MPTNCSFKWTDARSSVAWRALIGQYLSSSTCLKNGATLAQGHAQIALNRNNQGLHKGFWNYGDVHLIASIAGYVRHGLMANANRFLIGESVNPIDTKVPADARLFHATERHIRVDQIMRVDPDGADFDTRGDVHCRLQTGGP